MSSLPSFLTHCARHVEKVPLLQPAGRVVALIGSGVEALGLNAPALGDLVRIDAGAARAVSAEVVGFRDARTVLMPLEDPSGIGPGARVAPATRGRSAPPARSALGRVLDGLGRPIDGGPPLPTGTGPAPTPALLEREPVGRALDLGVRAINALCTVGRGARIGLFSGSGVGKSTLLGQIARGTRADSIVVALVGERGREVREFVDRILGEARSKAIVVVATSDQSPALRRRAAWLASEMAAALRSDGDDVLLLMDSLSRFAAAEREIGLAAGEPPATRGYPPSVWGALPRLIERAGTAEGPGSVTALYTVLVEGEVDDDPIADAIRSFLDGHIVLSRRRAERGQYPAIDPLASVSRVMRDVVPEEVRACADRARALLSLHAEAEDLIQIGAYQPGQHAATDEAVRLEPALREFLCQAPDEAVDLEGSFAGLAGALGGEI